MSLTREQLAAQAPELLAAVLAEGAATGATAERERIQAVQGQLIPGHEALINAMAFDGKSTAGDAAMAVLGAEKTIRTKQAAALAGDAPAPLALEPTATVVPTGKKQLSRTELDAAAKAHMAANPGTDYVAAVKHVQANA